MKISRFSFVIVVLILFMAGCASSGKAALLERKDPIALVSIISNKDVNWQGDAPLDTNNIGPFVRRKLRAEQDLTVVTKMDDLINTAESVLVESLNASRHFVVADKETVLQSAAYQNAKERKFPNRVMVAAENYKFIDYKDKNFLAALALETGIQRSMFVEFNITKYVYTGFSLMGNIKANVEMTVLVLDSRGKTIFRGANSVASLGGTKTVSGTYSQSEFAAIIEEALADVYFAFFEQFED